MKYAGRVFFPLLMLLVFSGDYQATERAGKCWIFFSDRPVLAQHSLNPRAGYSPAAVQRRETRGDLPWGESDLPVDPGYVRQLQSAGATVLVESRWLNAVSALCDSGCRAKVSAFPFVQGIRPVAGYHRRPETIHEVVSTAGSAPREAGLSYGQSYAQLQQLKVPGMHNRGYAGQNETIAMFDSGFRKDHEALRDLTVLGEHDFVFGDSNVQDGGEFDSHGTSTWSCAGGKLPGQLYGPAYRANFLLAATEDIRSETVVEEDNWVAALEWADRLGATVVSSSLGYIDWYTPAQLDGRTAITSIAAGMAARRGIVLANSAGNEGPGPQTLGAPADAINILAVGGVDSAGEIAWFSSRGPTADGRIKPEVAARALDTFVATSTGTSTFGRGSGTSFSCPLVAGSAAVLLSARPNWTPLQVREAFMKTANRASTPDNTYGWGLPDLVKAFNYLPLRSIVFDHKPLRDTSNHTTPYLVSARIRAQRGLKANQTFLYWKTEGTGYHRIPMTPAPNVANRFQARIPAQSHTTVYYYLFARDSAGKIGKLPNNAPAQPFSFDVN